MSTVRIPPVLRAQAGGAKTVDLAGAAAGERDEVVILPAMAGGAG